MKNKIEFSNQRGKFTDAEVRQQIAESKAFWSSPAGVAENRRLEALRKSGSKRGVKFPALAAKQSTKPELSVTAARVRLLGKL